MGLVSKLKNILFEEEEIEIPVIEKKENKPVNTVNTEAKKEEIKKSTNFETIEVLDEDLRASSTKKEEPVSEREIFKSEKTFNFPAFDEEEFESFTPKVRSTNVLEHEKKKRAHSVSFLFSSGISLFYDMAEAARRELGGADFSENSAFPCACQ